MRFKIVILCEENTRLLKKVHGLGKKEKVLTIEGSLPSSTAIKNLYRNLAVLLHLPAQENHGLNSFEDLLFHYWPKRYSWIYKDCVKAEPTFFERLLDPPDEMS